MSEKFDLLGAMGEISEKYVAEHMERSEEKSARKMTKRAWISVAACAAVVCASVVGVMASRGSGTTDLPTDTRSVLEAVVTDRQDKSAGTNVPDKPMIKESDVVGEDDAVTDEVTEYADVTEPDYSDQVPDTTAPSHYPCVEKHEVLWVGDVGQNLVESEFALEAPAEGTAMIPPLLIKPGITLDDGEFYAFDVRFFSQSLVADIYDEINAVEWDCAEKTENVNDRINAYKLGGGDLDSAEYAELLCEQYRIVKERNEKVKSLNEKAQRKIDRCGLDFFESVGIVFDPLTVIRSYGEGSTFWENHYIVYLSPEMIRRMDVPDSVGIMFIPAPADWQGQSEVTIDMTSEDFIVEE